MNRVRNRAIVDQQVHTPNDGRGPRDVYVNGKLNTHCVYANVRKGVARVFVLPLRLDKYRKRFLTRTLHGHVRVLPCECNEEGQGNG